MQSELSSWQQEKLLKLYRLLDNDGDGSLDEGEMENILDRLRVDTGWPESSRVVRHVSARWRLLLRALFRERTSVKPEGWVEAFARFLQADRQRRLADESYRGPLEELAQLLFLLLDRDRNDAIEPEELLLFFYALGRTDADARESFKHLDRHGDGVISRSELEDLALEYFHSSEPGSSGDWLFGPPS